jgi:hypothetical protein
MSLTESVLEALAAREQTSVDAFLLSLEQIQRRSWMSEIEGRQVSVQRSRPNLYLRRNLLAHVAQHPGTNQRALQKSLKHTADAIKAAVRMALEDKCLSEVAVGRYRITERGRIEVEE